MEFVPKFSDPVELAVKKLVNGSHLSNVRDFAAILELRDIVEGDPLPVVTCETFGVDVEEDSVNSSTAYMITIWDYIPDVVDCKTEEEVHELAVYTVKNYMEDLLEITNILVEKTDDLFGRADYTHEGVRSFKPRYRTSVFDSKVEAKNSKLRDRLIGATVIGRLHGRVEYICCSKGNFDLF